MVVVLLFRGSSYHGRNEGGSDGGVAACGAGGPALAHENRDPLDEPFRLILRDERSGVVDLGHARVRRDARASAPGVRGHRHDARPQRVWCFGNATWGGRALRPCAERMARRGLDLAAPRNVRGRF